MSASEEKASNGFNISSEDSAFSSRSKDIFGNLGVIEKKHDAFLKS